MEMTGLLRPAWSDTRISRVGWLYPGRPCLGSRLPSPLLTFPTLTVGRPFTGGYCDLEGSLMLRVGAASHLAHILAGVGRGDMIEPQQGAMSLPERKRRKPSRVLENEASSQARLFLQETWELGLQLWD